MEKLSKEKVSALVKTKWSQFTRDEVELVDALSKLEEGEGLFLNDKEWPKTLRPNVKQITVAVHDYSNNIWVFGTRRIQDKGWVIYRREEKVLMRKDEHLQ